MNEYHPRNEWKYIPRWLTNKFNAAIKDHPIVVITGARQVGKSTFLRNSEPARNMPYLTFDDLDLLAEASRNPASLLAGKSAIIIDEVQKSPGILSEVKKAVDSTNRNIRVVLSGSANLLLMAQVSETLAGRAVFITIESMAFRESRGQKPKQLLRKFMTSNHSAVDAIDMIKESAATIILRGLTPAVLRYADKNAAIQWWEGYTTTFLERDLRTISRVDSLPDFRRLMRALSLRSGQMLNQTEVARDIKLPQPTVHRYINLLEMMCLVHRLPVYAINQSKRLIKAPKLYWFDPGLAAYLAGHYDEATLANSREWGGLFETLVFLQLKVWCSLQTPTAQLYYWRTSTGKEVDFIIEIRGALIAIEVKASEHVHYRDLDNLRLFMRDNRSLDVTGVVVYAGDEIKQMDASITAVPWHVLV